jgi:hypothetical protein
MTADGVRLQKPSVPLCACGHPAAQHDRVALRYCSASSASGSTRSCICSSDLPAEAAPTTVRGEYVRA